MSPIIDVWQASNRVSADILCPVPTYGILMYIPMRINIMLLVETLPIVSEKYLSTFRGIKSSIVNEVTRTISNFFKKRKINSFLPLRKFCARELVAFAAFRSLVFVLLVGFGLICVFVRLNFFCKKKKNWLGIPPVENVFVCIYFYLWKSLFIHDKLWGSFCVCVSSLLRMFLNSSCLWKSLFIYAHL